MDSGGAGQHGRVAVQGPAAARDPRADRGSGVAARVLGAGGWLGQGPRRRAGAPGRGGPVDRSEGLAVYFTARGLEELADRRGDDEVTLGWLAERLREFIDTAPDTES